MHPANIAIGRYEETSAKIGRGYHNTGCPENEEDVREANRDRDAPNGTRESGE